MPLNRQSLWWDEKRNAIYCYGGEKSYGNPVGNSQPTPPESIWKFTPNGNGTGQWTEAIGPTSDQSFPTSIIRLAGGASSNDEANAYYLGGYSSAATSPEVKYLNDAGLFDVPGLLTFDFGSLKLRNATAGGGIASDYKSGNWLDLSNMINVPKFGADGVFILLGGLDGRFQNITIYDKKTQTWLSQPASGTIPPPKTLICAVGVHDSNFQSYEMYVSLLY